MAITGQSASNLAIRGKAGNQYSEAVMAKISGLSIQIKISWWVKYYIEAINLFSLTFMTKPDFKRISDFIGKHGIKTVLVKTPPKRGS